MFEAAYSAIPVLVKIIGWMIAATGMTLHKRILHIGIARTLQINAELIGFNDFLKTRLLSEWQAAAMGINKRRRPRRHTPPASCGIGLGQSWNVFRHRSICYSGFRCLYCSCRVRRVTL